MSRNLLSALAVVGLATNVTARADEDSGFYVGAGVAEVNDDVDVDGFAARGTGFKVFGGYAFNRYFAAEAAYIDAGELEDTIEDVHLTVESDGFVVAALGKLPIGESFSLFVKLGYTFYDEQVTAQRAAFNFSQNNSDQDLLYGGGAALHLGRKLRLSAEYEVVDVSNADFDLLSVSAAFRF